MSYVAQFDEERMFGIELEVYGVKHERIARAIEAQGLSVAQVNWTRKVLPTWRVSYDSSILGEDSAEIASPVLCGRDGIDQIHRVTSVLADIGCQVNKSCGFHVHHCCSDYTGKNSLSLLRLYTKFEGVIDYLVAPSRRGNLNKHCRSMVKDSDLTWVTELDKTERKRAIDVALKFGAAHTEWVTDPETGRPVERGSRYHKLNITAYAQYGTAEFRQHQGTLNPSKVVNWTVFTQQLVNKSKQVAVSKQVSAKPTLGELLRVLKLVDYQLVESSCKDPLILNLGDWLKERYTLFRGGMDDD